MITKVAFVGHPTRDLEATGHFYREVLGLEKAAQYGDFWAEYTTPGGGTIALDTFSPKQNPQASVYMALETDDIETELKGLKEKGAQVLHDTWENTGETGVCVCKMALIADPEGNMIMLHEIAPERVVG